MRLIDADAIRMPEYEPNTVMNTRDTMEHNSLARAVNGMIAVAPTVDAEPVNHGMWILRCIDEHNPHLNMLECSVCGTNIRLSLESNYCHNCGAKMDLQYEAEKETMETNSEKKKEISKEEMVGKFLTGFFAMCNNCVKSDVCKLRNAEEFNLDCKHFQNAMNYKRYGNINDMFQPIFDWLQFHYPHGEVYFFVERNRAMMLQEHGPCAFSKEITQCVAPLIKQDETEKENSK